MGVSNVLHFPNDLKYREIVRPHVSNIYQNVGIYTLCGRNILPWYHIVSAEDQDLTIGTCRPIFLYKVSVNKLLIRLCFESTAVKYG